jgi:hypothetical protein
LVQPLTVSSSRRLVLHTHTRTLIYIFTRTLFSRSCSLALSLSCFALYRPIFASPMSHLRPHTLTHTYAHIHTYRQRDRQTYTLTLILTLTLTHSFTRIPTLTRSLTLTHVYMCTFSHSHTYTHTHTHIHTHTHCALSTPPLLPARAHLPVWYLLLLARSLPFCPKRISHNSASMRPVHPAKVAYLHLRPHPQTPHHHLAPLHLHLPLPARR